MANDFDYNSPEYKAWRYKVLKRDDFTCQLTKQRGGELEVHHIIPASKAPHLVFNVTNGITLSKAAHETVTGREEQYEALFKRIIAEKMHLKKTHGMMPKGKWYPRNPSNRY